jgi:formylglycine-generating enzyme required for sulfatase activity
MLAPAASPEAGERALEFLRRNVGPGTSARINQGNPALARQAVDAAACRRGLEGVTLQTPEQKAFCGAENMVPLYRGGKAGEARACIDVFEFPNVACELPLVWASPTQAKAMCEAQGKRLCSQDEWVTACAADPAGGPDRRYAYGDELDLEACNTNKPAASFGGPPCDPDTAADAFRTCRTNSEPAGAFPRCRSRLGVFDLHGNVAEIMTRRDEDGHLVSQLKGSAFFYVDVARRLDERFAPKRMRETYPDHCAHDPRWHVEPMANAWHVNYHLGFRCCKTVAQRAETRTARSRGQGRPSRAAKKSR